MPAYIATAGVHLSATWGAGSFKELCSNPKTKEHLLKELLATGKAAKLKARTLACLSCHLIAMLSAFLHCLVHLPHKQLAQLYAGISA